MAEIPLSVGMSHVTWAMKSAYDQVLDPSLAGHVTSLNVTRFWNESAVKRGGGSLSYGKRMS